MKTINKILILLVLSTCGYGQCPTATKNVNYKYYTVCYSEKYKNPIVVTYKIYKPKKKVNRAGMDFYKDAKVNTADNSDFKNNVYDKGHMANCLDFADSYEKMKSTFSYVNCAVQHGDLNRGLWKTLENKVHAWAQKDSLLIINRVYVTSSDSRVRPGGAYIPSSFEKEIIFLSTKKKLKYKFPNKMCRGGLDRYKQ